jgi:hypothetical protein
MMVRLRPLLTYANVMSTLALFIALGGVSYAAATLPRNSVGATQLKASAVTGAKVKNESLTGADVKDRSLTAADFKGGVPAGPAGAKGDAGPAGSAGPAGAAGAKGDTGPAPAGPEAWHEIGSDGEPVFQSSFHNDGGNEVTGAFYKDAWGIVHLKGLVVGGTTGTIFTLPAGYRPSKNLAEIVVRGAGTAELVVLPNGQVQIMSGSSSVAFDGVTWRADE